MDRSRAMKMAAAAGNGDEQDRIEGSTAHDPADGDDSFSFESLVIFLVLLRMQLSTEPPSSEGAMDGVQRLSQGSMTTARTTMGATVIRTSCSEGGMRVEVRACAKDPMQVFPAGRAFSAIGGVAVHRGDAKWSCPD